MRCPRRLVVLSQTHDLLNLRRRDRRLAVATLTHYPELGQPLRREPLVAALLRLTQTLAEQDQQPSREIGVVIQQLLEYGWVNGKGWPSIALISPK